MAYLRLLTNALLAGGLGAVMCGHLLLFLNPSVSLDAGTAFALGWRLLVTVTVALGAAFYVASLARYLFSRRSPGWLSLRLLTWMTTSVVGAGALLMWLNLSAFGAALPSDTTRRMALAVGVLATGTVVLLVIALVHYSFGRRGSRVGGMLYGIAVVGVMVLPLVARGAAVPSRPEVTLLAPDLAVRDTPGGRVWLLLLDGASLDYISPAAASGRLPNLGRMLDSGASLTLFSIEPSHPEPVAAAVATGRYPPGNGIPSATAYRAGGVVIDLLPRYVFAYVLPRLGLVEAVPRRAGDIRAPTLWRMLGAAGLGTVIAGWPLATPVVDATSVVLAAPAGAHDVDESQTADRTLRARFDAAIAGRTPLVLALRYGILSDPGRDLLSQRDATTGRSLLDRQYEFLDAQVGDILGRLAETDLLLVMSGFRLESASPVERLRHRLLDDAGLAAEASRSDGFLLAYGRLVAPGRKPVGAIVDILPTGLYFLGLPVARDIDGYPRTDLFVSSFTNERPVAYVPSYEAP